METIRAIMYIIWSMVGITIIGGTMYSISFYTKFYRELIKQEKEVK